MAKVRRICSRVALASVLFWIGTTPGQIQPYPNKVLDIAAHDPSASAPCSASGDVLMVKEAARPYVPCQEPKRVAPEMNPKSPQTLIRVEPIYPQGIRKAGIGGPCIVELFINQLGEVSNARFMRCPPKLEDVTLASIRLWHYFPRYQDGESIRQQAVAMLEFDPRHSRWDGRVGVIVDSKGDLHDFDGEPVSRSRLQSSNFIIVTCDPSVTYSVLENTLRGMEDHEIRNFLLSSWSYAFKSGHLFYRYLCGAVKSSDPDEEIHPPQLEIDLDHLAKLAKSSGLPAFLPSSSLETYLSYVIYVNQRGEIIEVESTGGPIVPIVEEALRHARVLQPGQRGTVHVPATLSVFVPIK